MISKIRIKNFGPIKSGYDDNDGFIPIDKITVFVGNQGSGKSTVAKLISTLSWLEKALHRGDVREKHELQYNRFVKFYCGYQNLTNYFQPSSEIEYVGPAYSFTYKSSAFTFSPNNETKQSYKVPKIMYVPAERNFLSAVENPDKLKGIPKTLATFWAELERSFRELSEAVPLPVGDVKLEYDRLNKITKVSGPDYKIRLSEASSGFQSYIPLYIVSKNLSESIEKDQDSPASTLTGEQQKKLKTEVQKILSNPKLSEDVKRTALEVLSAKYRNGSFLNIVEEVEQNLFPDSQKAVLFELLRFANILPENRLILTTHSPYIINYLTLAIKGNQLRMHPKFAASDQALKERLNVIVPEKSGIAAQSSSFFQLTPAGEIRKLPKDHDLPTDENFLNLILSEINDSFAKLLEIEDEL